MKEKRLLVLGVLVAALIIATGATAIAIAQTDASGAAVTEDEAVSIASGEADGAVVDVATESEGGTLVYEVTLDSGVEVEIDGTTGDVLEVETSDQDETEDADGAEDDDAGKD